MAGTDVSMGLTHVSENKEPFQPLPEPFPDLLPLSNVTKRNNCIISARVKDKLKEISAKCTFSYFFVQNWW